MMTRHNIQAAAEAFWEKAGGRVRFGTPVDIEKAASWALSVAIYRISGLHSGIVSGLLKRINADAWIEETSRSLRGCLIADTGKALMLLESDDPDDEQRMTIAHEIAHLLLHYLKPRDEAVRAFGPGIISVLDRTRPPTAGERVSSILRNVQIEPYRHAMDRGTSHNARAVNAIEDEADDLAVELLAPWQELQRLRGASPGALRARFGLPAPVATRLSVLITPSATSGVLGLFPRK